MPAKRLAIWAVLMGSMSLVGCCRMCDRWCPDRHQPVAYQPPAPQCCVPAQVCCPPGTVPAQGFGGYPAAPAAQPAGWQRNYSQAPGQQMFPPAGQPMCCD